MPVDVDPFLHRGGNQVEPRRTENLMLKSSPLESYVSDMKATFKKTAQFYNVYLIIISCYGHRSAGILSVQYMT